MVAHDALDVLTDEIIDYVSTVAAQQSEKEIQETTQIPVLQQHIKDVDTKLRNLLKALEASSSAPDIIVTRIAELEAQKKALTAQLTEESRSVISLTKDMVTCFLENVRTQEIPLETQKPMLLDLLVNSVTIYDDTPGFITIKTAYNLTKIPGKTYRIPTSKCSDINQIGSPQKSGLLLQAALLLSPALTILEGRTIIKTQGDARRKQAPPRGGNPTVATYTYGSSS